MLNILLVYVLSHSASDGELVQLLEGMPPEGISEIFSSPLTLKNFREPSNFEYLVANAREMMVSFAGRCNPGLWLEKLTELSFIQYDADKKTIKPSDRFLFLGLHTFVSLGAYELTSPFKQELSVNQINIEQVAGGLKYELNGYAGIISLKEVSPGFKQKLGDLQRLPEGNTSLVRELSKHLPEILEIISTQSGINLFYEQEQVYWKTIMKVALYAILSHVELVIPHDSQDSSSAHILRVAQNIIEYTPPAHEVGLIERIKLIRQNHASLSSEKLRLMFCYEILSHKPSDVILRYITSNSISSSISLENRINILEAFEALMLGSCVCLQHLRAIYLLDTMFLKEDLKNEFKFEQILKLFKTVISTPEPREEFEKEIKLFILRNLLNFFNTCLLISFSNSESCSVNSDTHFNLLLCYIRAHSENLDNSCWREFLEVFLTITNNLEKYNWRSACKLVSTFCDFYVICGGNIEKRLSEDPERKGLKHEKVMLKLLRGIINNFVLKYALTLMPYIINDLCEHGRYLEGYTLNNAIDTSHSIYFLSTNNGLNSLELFITLQGFLQSIEYGIRPPNIAMKYYNELMNLLLFLDHLIDPSKEGCRCLFIKTRGLEDVRSSMDATAAGASLDAAAALELKTEVGAEQKAKKKSTALAIVSPEIREAAAAERLQGVADIAKDNHEAPIALGSASLALPLVVARKAGEGSKRAETLEVGEPNALLENAEYTSGEPASPSMGRYRSCSTLASRSRQPFFSAPQAKQEFGEGTIPLVSVSQEAKAAEKGSRVSDKQFFTTPVKKQAEIKQFFAQSIPVQEAFKNLEKAHFSKATLSDLKGQLNKYYNELIQKPKDDATIKNDIDRIVKKCILINIDLIAEDMIKIYQHYLSENHASTAGEEVDGSYAPNAKSPK